MIVSSDDVIESILSNSRTIAVVGHSDKPQRTSYQIAKYLHRVRYTVFPVNPTVETIDGRRSYKRLADIDEAIDIVNVFRRSEHLAAVVREVAKLEAPPMVVWAQLGVESEAAAKIAEEADIALIMDRCIKVEHARLLR